MKSLPNFFFYNFQPHCWGQKKSKGKIKMLLVFFFCFPAWTHFLFIISHNKRTWCALNKPPRSIYQISLYKDCASRAKTVSITECVPGCVYFWNIYKTSGNAEEKNRWGWRRGRKQEAL